MLLLRPLVVGEHPAADEEAQAARALDREARAAPRHHVDGEVRVLPVLELRRPDEEGRAGHDAEQHVALADAELAARVAHGGAPVAAAARLVEHQRPVLAREVGEQGSGGVRHKNQNPYPKRFHQC